MTVQQQTQPQQETRESVLQRFFAPIPAKPNYTRAIVALVFGGLALLGALAMVVAVASSDSSDAAAALCCAIPFGLGGLAGVIGGGLSYLSKSSAYQQAYARAFPRPPDEVVDRYLDEDLQRLERQGLRRLNLVESDVLDGPGAAGPTALSIVALGYGARVAYGQDGKARFSRYDVMFVFLSGWHMSIYMSTLEFIPGIHTNERTKEYHYEDVVGVETERIGAGLAAPVAVPVPGAVPSAYPPPPVPPGQPGAGMAPGLLTTAEGRSVEITLVQQFRLLIKSGDRVEMVISATDRQQVNYDALNPTDADRTIQRIQRELRDKKKGGTRRMSTDGDL